MLTEYREVLHDYTMYESEVPEGAPLPSQWQSDTDDQSDRVNGPG
jgi:hypothetical protein